MYTPQEFRWQDREEIEAFIQAHPFGLLATNGDPYPQATHLPFHLYRKENETVLTAHLAAANPHAATLDGAKALAVFSGPNAYVSPALYHHPRNVPTWNYLAVHVHGTIRVATGEDERWRIVEQLLAQQEPAFLEQWRTLDPNYVAALFKGIVAFEMTIDRIDAKRKLSQNKTEAERKDIGDHLAQSSDAAAQELGETMQHNLNATRGTTNADEALQKN